MKVMLVDKTWSFAWAPGLLHGTKAYTRCLMPYEQNNRTRVFSNTNIWYGWLRRAVFMVAIHGCLDTFQFCWILFINQMCNLCWIGSSKPWCKIWCVKRVNWQRYPFPSCFDWSLVRITGIFFIIIGKLNCSWIHGIHFGAIWVFGTPTVLYPLNLELEMRLVIDVFWRQYHQTQQVGSVFEGHLNIKDKWVLGSRPDTLFYFQTLWSILRPISFRDVSQIIAAFLMFWWMESCFCPLSPTSYIISFWE